MKKKLIIISISLVSVILLAGFYYYISLRNQSSEVVSKQEKSEQTTITELHIQETTESEKLSELPTYSELRDELGSEFEDLGACQIITVLYEDKNLAILENMDGIRVTTSLQLDDEQNLIFTLNDVSPSMKNLKIGQKIFLMRVGDKLYAYKAI